MLLLLILAFLLMGMPTGVFSLDPQKAVTQYTLDRWDDESILPQNFIKTILQTSDGFLWIGTENGLVRSDGIKFKIFDKNNTPAFTNDYISCLYEDNQKNLWIGTFGGGLLVYKNDIFRRFTGKDGISHLFINSIQQDSHGDIWIGTGDGGLYQYKKNKFVLYKKEHGLPDNIIRCIYADSKGNLWIGTSQGLSCFRDDKFINYRVETIPRSDGSSGGDIKAICEDNQQQLWIGTNKALYLMKAGNFIEHKMKTDTSISGIRDIFEDKHNNIWLATKENGLIRYYAGIFSFLDKKRGFPTNNVLAVTEDSEGNLWVGTSTGGLIRLKDEKFTTITTKEGLSDDIVLSIYQDSHGYLWIGTNNGLNRWKDGEFLYFTNKEGLTSNIVNSICEDRQGNIWVGTDKGLNLVRNSRSEIIKIKDYLQEQDILAILEDKAGNIWVGTLNGAVKIREQTFQEFKQKDGLATNLINFIYEDSQGNLWFSTIGGGVTKYKDHKFTVYTTSNGLAHKALSCIYEDEDAVLWMGSQNGLNRFNDGKFTRYSQTDGLFYNTICYILDDEKGYLWMSSRRGIFRVWKKDLNDFAHGYIHYFESEAYDKEDGMGSSECNGGVQSAGCKTTDGKLWFPTMKGVVMIDPGKIKTNRIPPPVVIEHILLDGVLTYPSREVKVSPEVKRMGIYFTALCLSNPQKVKFKYQLQGYENHWNDAKTQRVAWYTNLEPGIYQFIVTACNNDGLWNKKGAAINIKVLGPFWKSTGFRMIIVLVIVVFSGLLIYFLGKYITFAIFWKKQKYIGKFKLLEKIASGGMGTVYKAVNLMDKSEKVAIKVLREEMLSPENIKRFKQEVAIIDQMDHPNIVKVLERGQTGQNLFLAMEFLQGRTLAKKIENEKNLDLEEALHIMIQITDALVQIHSKNIIHRDLKPVNVFLIEKEGESNFVKLLDFGLAKTQYQTRLTQTGYILGTIDYMAPEQVVGKGVSSASDIYALGIMFYEIITGKKPFKGYSSVEIMKQISDSKPTAPIRFREDVPEELNQLIMKMLNKDRKSRPNINEVMDQLKLINFNLLKEDKSY